MMNEICIDILSITGDYFVIPTVSEVCSNYFHNYSIGHIGTSDKLFTLHLNLIRQNSKSRCQLFAGLFSFERTLNFF